MNNARALTKTAEINRSEEITEFDIPERAFVKGALSRA